MSNTKDTVTIPTREYIELLRCKAASSLASLKDAAARTAKPKASNGWASTVEKSEIIRLHKLGYRVGEISMVVGRSRGTVRRYIQKSATT